MTCFSVTHRTAVQNIQFPLSEYQMSLNNSLCPSPSIRTLLNKMPEHLSLCRQAGMVMIVNPMVFQQQLFGKAHNCFWCIVMCSSIRCPLQLGLVLVLLRILSGYILFFSHCPISWLYFSRGRSGWRNTSVWIIHFKPWWHPSIWHSSSWICCSNNRSQKLFLVEANYSFSLV